MVPSPDGLGVHFFQLAAEWRTEAHIAVAYHSFQLQLLYDAINMHQCLLTSFFFFFCQKQMNILSISRKTQGKWIYESWVIGIPRVRGGCDYTSELIFTDAVMQDSPWRPVCQTATRFAEKLDYSCSDGEGAGNLERPLKYQLHLYLQSKLNTHEGHCSHWLLEVCMNLVLHLMFGNSRRHAYTPKHSVYSFPPFFKFNFNNCKKAHYIYFHS